MTSRHDLCLIQSLEEELFKQWCGSPEAASKLLAENFIEFGRSGRVYRKEDVVRSLAAEGADNSQAPTAELTSLADDIVLVTYRSLRKNKDGKELHSLRSSIWKLIGGRWQMIFHQGTPTHPTL